MGVARRFYDGNPGNRRGTESTLQEHCTCVMHSSASISHIVHRTSYSVQRTWPYMLLTLACPLLLATFSRTQHSICRLDPMSPALSPHLAGTLPCASSTFGLHLHLVPLVDVPYCAVYYQSSLRTCPSSYLPIVPRYYSHFPSQAQYCAPLSSYQSSRSESTGVTLLFLSLALLLRMVAASAR